MPWGAEPSQTLLKGTFFFILEQLNRLTRVKWSNDSSHFIVWLEWSFSWVVKLVNYNRLFGLSRRWFCWHKRALLKNKRALSWVIRLLVVNLQRHYDKRWSIISNSSVRCNGSKTDSCLHQFFSATTCWSGISFCQRSSCSCHFAWFRAPSIASMTYRMWKQIGSTPRSASVQ